MSKEHWLSPAFTMVPHSYVPKGAYQVVWEEYNRVVFHSDKKEEAIRALKSWQASSSGAKLYYRP